MQGSDFRENILPSGKKITVSLCAYVVVIQTPFFIDWTLSVCQRRVQVRVRVSLAELQFAKNVGSAMQLKCIWHCKMQCLHQM